MKVIILVLLLLGAFIPVVQAEEVVTRGELLDVIATEMHISNDDAKQYLTYQHAWNLEGVAVREDVIVAIVFMAGYQDKLPENWITEGMFTDWDSVSNPLKNTITIAVQYGLVSGYYDETIRAQDVVTPDLLHLMMWRMHKILE